MRYNICIKIRQFNQETFQFLQKNGMYIKNLNIKLWEQHFMSPLNIFKLMNGCTALESAYQLYAKNQIIIILQLVLVLY